uniref:Reverse transcriptase domain-containing protein n=1 Tax=Triticum urartu TaxID=4572 RepID=A0A8R7VBS1_TRIUA
MNVDICKPLTDQEISDALFQIGPLKAPGPDGFPARFFQRNWGVLKEDIIHAVKKFFHTGTMPEGVNDTVIVLIPKVKNPQSIKDFRPISLCNVIYKIISKCLVNRLRPHLDGMISPTQSAFIPGRLISDNALIAFECMHSLSTLKDGRGEFCAYKLDLAKAYDRVDWNFLKCMLSAVGFAPEWIKWIMACVTSVKFSVRFNGQLLESFSPSCGIRQGDPLSPYLFLFVAEALSLLLQNACTSGSLLEFKVNRQAPGISHLLFADDCLLFFKGSIEQALAIKNIITTYEKGTGQLLSPDKCFILFGKNCSMEVQVAIMVILCITSEGFEDKYLGLPVPQ